ncbi:MAG TPA: ATP-binding protein [Candidatus Acidoferrales bacterium]|jgi:anti-sigma regulatory factor (Ser/Thr protein kinase)|nr:ATP-binding protein [Candidatus Acidoferrales bacterium]
MNPIAAKQPRDMRKSAKLNRSFLLKLELRSHPNLLCVIRGALEPLMDILGFSAEHNRAIIRAVDEAVSNIVRHSYHGRPNQPIEVYCNRLHRRTNGETEQGVEILLFDCGAAVDTTKIEARPLDEIRPGGLGLHIIRGSVDTVEYKRAGRLNRLRLVKYARSSEGGCGSSAVTLS